VVKSRATSRANGREVTGSNPAAEKSAEAPGAHWKNLCSQIPAAEKLQSGVGASYFVKRMRVRIPPAVKAAVTQMAEQSPLGPLVPSARKLRCGEGTRYFYQRAFRHLSERMRLRNLPVPRGTEAQTKTRGPMVPTRRKKRTARIGCATEMPGWRGGELLRLSHDVGLRLRSSARLFLPAKFEGPGGASPAPTEVR
jgi:hypothetical protein